MTKLSLFYKIIFVMLYALCVSSGYALEMVGAGATFPYPLYSKWFSEYQKLNPDQKINYQSIGSGGGIRQVMAGTVDFGASDAPMKDAQLLDAAKKGLSIIHIPTALGAVVLSYHLPGVQGALKLTPSLLAQIFLGKIKFWDDPQIQTLNPALALPHLSVIVIYRSDGSGTTFVMTEYLSKISSEWKEKVSQGTSIRFPIGMGGKGNEGVTGLIKRTPGSIGYVELIFAISNHLDYALLQNAAGEFVKAESTSVTSAALSSLAQMPSDFRVSIVNASGQHSYPISSYTYLLIPSEPSTVKSENKNKLSRAKTLEMLKLFKWCLSEGNRYVTDLGYAPLPDSLRVMALKKLGEIQ
jgi:phosphate transport system substrate-binding protein